MSTITLTLTVDEAKLLANAAELRGLHLSEKQHSGIMASGETLLDIASELEIKIAEATQ